MIIDTGVIVAFLAQRDEHHAWAKRIFTLFDLPFETCEAVVTEASHLLGSSSLVLQLIERGELSIAFDLNEHHLQLAELAQKYRDRHPDFADLCLVRMSELRPSSSIITIDGDFQIYRKNRNEVISVIMPT